MKGGTEVVKRVESFAASSQDRLRASLDNATDTKMVEVGSGAVETVVDLFHQCFGQQTAVVVADSNTYDVLGSQVVERFAASGRPMRDPFVFRQERLPAHYEEVEALASFLRGHQAIPIAVGSGTINDLTKLASHQTERRYMSVATAASMDGYTAFGSSITRDGFKQHFPCPAPVAVVADLDVIRKAPEGMNASGYADLLAKIVSGADWIVADAIGVDPIRDAGWSLIQPNLRQWCANPAGVRQGDLEVVAYMIEGLIMAGLAMQACKASRPAAGAEHQFSHLWDMQGHTHGKEAPSHGFKVGIGTLASASLHERLLEYEAGDWDIETFVASWPNRETLVQRARDMHSLPNLRRVAETEVDAKYIDQGKLRQRLEHLRKIWPDLKIQLKQQLIPARDLKKMLQTVGAPTEPEQIGIDRNRFHTSYHLAQTIRRRYTVLDLAFETGRFDRDVSSLFEPSGFWGSPR